MATWLDKINNIDLEIITGDGSGFLPDYFIASVNKQIDYNISEFVFKDIDGSLVIRGRPKGTRYNIEFIFKGLNNLDEGKRFQKAAADPRAWNIRHPMYGTMKVQPISIHYDDSKLNVTTITGEIIETLGVSDLKDITDFPPDVIKTKHAEVSKDFTISYSSGVPTPSVSDIQAAIGHVKASYAAVSAKLNGYQQDLDDYLTAYNKANAALNSVIYDSMAIATQVQNLITAPALFADTVVRRLAMFTSQLAIFAQDVEIILAAYNKPTRSLKKLYENNAGAAVLGMCLTSITNILDDYAYRVNVLSVIATIISSYNAYVTNLYTLQSANGGQIDSYIPDAASLTGLAQLVNYTTSSLLTLSANSKQQRIITLSKDTCLIRLAKDLYGLQEDDSTINTLKVTNNIGINEILQLKKGREIIYYV